MGITVNINKAKEIWKDKIRVARKPKLEELDIILPQASKPVANYSPYVIADNNIYISGQIPFKQGNLILLRYS